MSESIGSQPGGPTEDANVQARPATRSRIVRFAAGVLALLIVYRPTAILNIPMEQWKLGPGGSGWYVSVDPVDLLITLATALLAIVALPRVSYRRIDVLILLVPIWGWIVTWRLGWRLALLPWRDWPPRFDEHPRVRSAPGTELYILDDKPVRSHNDG